MSLVITRRAFMPLFVVALLSGTSAADRAVTVVGSSEGKELETVTAAAREAVERASWTVIAHDLPPERIGEVIRCSTGGDGRCIGQLLDEVGADRLIALKLADETYRDRPVRVVYGTILRRGADVLASSQRYCESCRDELLANHVRSLVMDLVRGARSKLNPATLVVRSVPSGARVKLDGETVGPTDLELPIRAGVHMLELALKDYQPFSQEITVGDGQRQKLEVRLVPSEGMRRAGDHDAGTGVVPMRRPNQQKLAPWLALGGGAALALGGGILIAVDEDEVQHGTVVPGYRDTATGGAALATAGVVALAAGAAWLIFGRF